jgi:hypothetical protein
MQAASKIHENGIAAKQYLYRLITGPEVERGSGSSISRPSALEGGKVASHRYRPSLLSRKYSWYLFLVEGESTPRPECGRKVYVNRKFQ